MKLDLSEVEGSEGVVRVITGHDAPGKNDTSPHLGDEPMLATDEIAFHGRQSSRWSPQAARPRASRPGSRGWKSSRRSQPFPWMMPAPRAVACCRITPGKNPRVANALEASPLRLTGEIEIGGQEHFYLEGQAAFAFPGEGDEMLVHSSTQHPSEVQHIVARVLGVADHNITIECRRMGGGFGGKESQASQFAAIAALAAHLTAGPAN